MKSGMVIHASRPSRCRISTGLKPAWATEWAPGFPGPCSEADSDDNQPQRRMLEVQPLWGLEEGVAPLELVVEVMVRPPLECWHPNPGHLQEWQILVTGHPSSPQDRVLCGPDRPGTHYTDQADFIVAILFLPLSPKCWDCSWAPPCPAL